MKSRTPRLMVADKTSKFEGINQFLKVPYITGICENEISNQRFKSKKDNKHKYGQQTQKSNLKDNKRNTPVLEWEFLSDCAIS